MTLMHAWVTFEILPTETKIYKKYGQVIKCPPSCIQGNTHILVNFEIFS